MNATASATYFATEESGTYTYVLLLRNTSSIPYDIYASLFGQQYLVPYIIGSLQNVVPISVPQGWELIPFIAYYGGAGGQTNFTGNASTSGYIMPNDVGIFVFQSSTPPPKKMPFGCCFWNGSNEWGFCFDGTAELVHCIPIAEFPRPWIHSSNSRAQSKQRITSSAIGVTSRDVKVSDTGPSITVSWDRFGNVIHLAPLAAHPPDSRGK